MTKYSYRISSSSPSGWQWQVYQEKPRKLVRSGSEKGKIEAEAAARKTIAELATDNKK
jgi:hypothetical protein